MLLLLCTRATPIHFNELEPRNSCRHFSIVGAVDIRSGSTDDLVVGHRTMHIFMDRDDCM